MNYRTVVFVAFVNILGLLSVGDGSGILGLGMLTPLLPVAQITGTSICSNSGNIAELIEIVAVKC